MKIFQIQDEDTPMFVLANDWSEALEKWRSKIAEENDVQVSRADPQGISMIADDNEVIQ